MIYLSKLGILVLALSFLSSTSVTSATLKPLQDRVVVRRIDQEAKIAGGIAIPDTAKEKPLAGEVVSVGPDTSLGEGKAYLPDVKAGDRVLFGKYTGTEVKIDGQEYFIMRESDIMGVLK